MYQQRSLSKSILDLFYQNPGATYTEEELAKSLDIGKHQMSSLKTAIFQLIRNNKIINENDKYSLNSVREKRLPAKVLEGTFDASSLVKGNSYAFVNTTEGDYYVSSEDTLNAYHGDIVLVEERRADGRKLFGKIIEIKKRKYEQFTGDIITVGNRQYFLPDLSKIHSYFEIEGQLAKPGRKILMKVDDWGSKYLSRLPHGTAIEDLGESGKPESEFLAVVKQFDLPLSFPMSVTKDIKSLNQDEPVAEGRRRDFSELLTFTIDPATAKDFDDAISIFRIEEGYELYVHIADVAEYVTTSSSFFKEASKRGNSFYFPRNVIPMLPEILSNQICSLRPGEVKNTVSCYFKLDKQGSILNQYITESIIKSDYRFNYDEVDAYFTDVKPTFTPELDEALLIFKELSGILLEERVKKGYLNLELPEENFKFDEEGSITDIYLEYETVSHQMIENAMLLANELVAKRLKKNLPQSIFRTHDSPEEDRIEKLKFTLSAYNIKMIPNSKLNFTYQNILAQVDALGSHDIFDMMVLRSMKRAMYTTECKPHFGLAISTYTHFTSPIRRFSDLVVHHQIKSILNSEQEPKFTKAQLSFYANTCTEQENLADESEREITNRLIRAFMKNYVGEVMSGKVVELTKNKVILKLQTIPVRVILETYFLKDGPYEFDQQYYSLRQERGSRLIRLGDILTVTIDRITDEVFMKEVKEQDVDRVMTDTEKQRILDRTFNHDDPRNPVRPGHASREERRFGKSSGSQRFSPDRKSKDPRKSFTKDRKAPKSTGRRRKV